MRDGFTKILTFPIYEFLQFEERGGYEFEQKKKRRVSGDGLLRYVAGAVSVLESTRAF